MQKYFSELENMYFQFERAHQISSTICEKKKKNTKPHHCGVLGEKRERDPKGSWREKADLIQKIRNQIVSDFFTAVCYQKLEDVAFKILGEINFQP